MTIRIDDFIWLPEVIEKLLVKHHISPGEIEQVFYNHPRYRFHQKGHIQGEDLYTAMGQTDAGRYLIIFLLIKPNKRALVISARNMDRSERKRYDAKE